MPNIPSLQPTFPLPIAFGFDQPTVSTQSHTALPSPLPQTVSDSTVQFLM